MSSFSFCPFLRIVLVLTFFVAACRSSTPDLTWQRVQKQGVIRVGMDPNWVPFEFVDREGRLSGFDVELSQELGRRLGLETQFVANLGFDGLYDALTVDRADVIISAVNVDMGRSADFAYSIPYFEAGQVLIVGPYGGQIESMKDLGGRVLAVEMGSEGDMIARRWDRRIADLSLLHTDSAADAVISVLARQADAALTDRASALLALKMRTGQGPSPQGDVQEPEETNLHISTVPITDEQYAVVVRRDSENLLQFINAALTDMQRDGTLEALERKWLGP